MLAKQRPSVCARLRVGTTVGEVLLSALLRAQTQMKNILRLHTADYHPRTGTSRVRQLQIRIWTTRTSDGMTSGGSRGASMPWS
jgi:hypothetical protein